MHGLPVVSANAIGMAYGTFFLLIYSSWSGAPFTFDTTGSYIGSLAFLALFASAIAFGCYLTLIGRIGPEKAAYATVLFPIVALTLSTWVENFQWQGRAIAGVILVLGGNVIVLLGQTHFNTLIRLLRR
jgi:drug/metabolite transporter (DMT)-like permease